MHSLFIYADCSEFNYCCVTLVELSVSVYFSQNEKKHYTYFESTYMDTVKITHWNWYMNLWPKVNEQKNYGKNAWNMKGKKVEKNYDKFIIQLKKYRAKMIYSRLGTDEGSQSRWLSTVLSYERARLCESVVFTEDETEKKAEHTKRRIKSKAPQRPLKKKNNIEMLYYHGQQRIP